MVENIFILSFIIGVEMSIYVDDDNRIVYV
jgi:hypothetical protein